MNLTKNPDLVPEKMHLNDDSCKVTELNDTFAAFDIPLQGCGTKQDGSNPSYLLFSNTVHWNPEGPEGDLQTRTEGFKAYINCVYSRDGKVMHGVQIKRKESSTFRYILYLLIYYNN